MTDNVREFLEMQGAPFRQPDCPPVVKLTVPIATAHRMALRSFWRGIFIGATGLGVILSAGAAFSQTRMTLAPGSASCFAIVSIENRAGTYNADELLETPLGPVVLRYHTVGGHNALNADEVSVVSLPDGVAADPVFMALPDGDTGLVCLTVWIGG